MCTQTVSNYFHIGSRSTLLHQEINKACYNCSHLWDSICCWFIKHIACRTTPVHHDNVVITSLNPTYFILLPHVHTEPINIKPWMHFLLHCKQISCFTVYRLEMTTRYTVEEIQKVAVWMEVFGSSSTAREKIQQWFHKDPPNSYSPDVSCL